MNASIALQVLPETLDDEKTIAVVDEVIAYMKSSGLNCYVGPFETSVEGDLDELMDMLKECMKIAGRSNKEGVMAFMKVSYRPEGEVLTIEKKVTKHHIND